MIDHPVKFNPKIELQTPSSQKNYAQKQLIEKILPIVSASIEYHSDGFSNNLDSLLKLRKRRDFNSNQHALIKSIMIRKYFNPVHRKLVEAFSQLKNQMLDYEKNPKREKLEINEDDLRDFDKLVDVSLRVDIKGGRGLPRRLSPVHIANIKPIDFQELEGGILLLGNDLKSTPTWIRTEHVEMRLTDGGLEEHFGLTLEDLCSSELKPLDKINQDSDPDASYFKEFLEENGDVIEKGYCQFVKKKYGFDFSNRDSHLYVAIFKGDGSKKEFTVDFTKTYLVKDRILYLCMNTEFNQYDLEIGKFFNYKRNFEEKVETIRRVFHIQLDKVLKFWYILRTLPEGEFKPAHGPALTCPPLHDLTNAWQGERTERNERADKGKRSKSEKRTKLEELPEKTKSPRVQASASALKPIVQKKEIFLDKASYDTYHRLTSDDGRRPTWKETMQCFSKLGFSIDPVGGSIYRFKYKHNIAFYDENPEADEPEEEKKEVTKNFHKPHHANLTNSSPISHAHVKRFRKLLEEVGYGRENVREQV